MPRIHRRPAAERDLIEHYVYLAENAGADVADQFLDSTAASLALLAEQPQIGSPLNLKATALAGTRKWRVSSFENFLIFYQPREEGISVLRVLHASRDWWALFDVDAS